MDRVTEDDLLALIEGELAEDRIPVVEAALRADPVLVERVRAMREDREGLTDLARTDQAPAGLIEAALGTAARSRMIQVDTGGPVRAPSLARGSRGRKVQMAVAAALTLGALGVWAWLMVMVSTSSSRRVEIVAEARPVEQIKPERTKDDPPSLAGVGPATPEPMAPDAALPETNARTASKADDDDALIDEWMRNVVAAQDDQLAPDQGVGYLWGAALALEGRLRVEVEGDGPAPLVMLDAEGSARLDGAAIQRDENGESGDEWRVELRYRAEMGETALAVALERMVREIEARTGRRVRLVEAPGDAGAEPTPLAEAHSVLWWGQPSSEWSRRMAVRIPVSFVDED